MIKKMKAKIHFATQGGSGTVLGTSGDTDKKGAAPPPSRPVTSQPTHLTQSGSSRTSGSAAVSRFETKASASASHQPRPTSSGMLSEARRETEREKLTSGASAIGSTAVKVAQKLTVDDKGEATPSTGSARVIVDCPVTGKTIEYEQRLTHLQNTLQDLYLKEPLYSSCLMVRTLGSNSPTTTHLVGTSSGLSEKDKISACVETLSKCLKKIIEQPDEEKFRSIRCESKALKEKVLEIAGAELFLQAVGFVQEYRDFQGKQELFYVLPKPEQKGDSITTEDSGNTEQLIVTDSIEPGELGACKAEEPSQIDASKKKFETEAESLTTALDLLTKVTPIQLVLNRDVQVYRSTSSVQRFPDLPPSFYILKPDEVKKEHMLKKEQVEVNEMLLTRAQRERLDRQASRQYQFCVIRVRLPDGLVIQATFRAKEKLSDLYSFISKSLKNEATMFSLFHQGGKKLDTMTSSLQDAELVPAALVNMRVESGIGRDSMLKPFLIKNLKVLS